MQDLHAAAVKRLETALAVNGIPWDPRLANTTTRRLNEQAEYWEDKLPGGEPGRTRRGHHPDGRSQPARLRGRETHR